MDNPEVKPNGVGETNPEPEAEQVEVEEEEEELSEETKELLEAAREADEEVTNGNSKQEEEEGTPDETETPVKKQRGRPKLSLTQKKQAKEEAEDPAVSKHRDNQGISNQRIGKGKGKEDSIGTFKGNRKGNDV